MQAKPSLQKPKDPELAAKQKKSFFPSYSQIYSKITEAQQVQYKKKLQKINNKIQKLKQNINFDEQHRQLTKKLINQYRKENVFEKSKNEELSDLAVISNSKVSQKYRYADSLNQYLENSQEEENNYEAHLKFRKKALQRQLQADQQKKSTLKQKKHNSKHEQEQFFKSLYNAQYQANSHENTANKKAISRIKSEVLNKTANKDNKPDKQSKVTGLSIIQNRSKIRQQQKEKQLQSRYNQLMQNKRKLTQFYMNYVQALGHTNIVHWRILN